MGRDEHATVATTFTLLRGKPAILELERTGLLTQAAPLNLPLLPTDVYCLLDDPTGFLLIGYLDDQAIGYILGQFYYPGRGEKHLFLHQAFTNGMPVISLEAAAYLLVFAKETDCDAIATTVPPRLAPLMERTYRFKPMGVYMQRRMRSGH